LWQYGALFSRQIFARLIMAALFVRIGIDLYASEPVTNYAEAGVASVERWAAEAVLPSPTYSTRQTVRDPSSVTSSDPSFMTVVRDYAKQILKEKKAEAASSQEP
jgi:hypothetical protein